MCTAIALPVSELPVELIERCDLSARVHDRGGEREVRFYWRAVPALLPVWWDGRLRIVRWGNRDRDERKLPPTGWTWRETVEAGKWSALVLQRRVSRFTWRRSPFGDPPLAVTVGGAAVAFLTPLRPRQDLVGVPRPHVQQMNQ